MVLGLEMLESEQDVCTQTLQADNLQTATEVLRVCLAHGKSKAIAVHWTGSCPIDGVHHVAKDPVDLHELVSTLLRGGEVVLDDLVHQVMVYTATTVRDLDDEILMVAGQYHVYRWQVWPPNIVVVLYGGPDGVLEKLWQDVVQGHLNVGEVDASVTRDLNWRTVAVLVLTQLRHKVDPSLANVPQTHAKVDQTHIAVLVLLQQEVVSDQHPDPQSGGESLI